MVIDKDENKQLTIAYVDGLMSGSNGSPHPKLEETVDWINEKYQKLNIPWNLDLQSARSMIERCSNEAFMELGPSKEEVMTYLNPTSFEEAREKFGIVKSGSEWTYQGNILDRIESPATFDKEKGRFIRSFDIKGSIEYKLNIDQEINKSSSFNDIVKYNMAIDNNKMKVKKYSEAVERIQHIFLGEALCNDIEENMKRVNVSLANSYQFGDSLIPSLFFGDDICNVLLKAAKINIIDSAMMHINSRQSYDERIKLADDLSRILDEEIKKNGTDCIRIMPPAGTEEKQGSYEKLNSILDHVHNNSRTYLVTDMYEPQFKFPLQIHHPYFILRSTIGDRSYASLVGIDQMPVDTVKFILLHELGHRIANEKDITDYDRVDDQRLMLAPVDYSQLNGRKISDASIIEVYSKVMR